MASDVAYPLVHFYRALWSRSASKASSGVSLTWPFVLGESTGWVVVPGSSSAALSCPVAWRSASSRVQLGWYCGKLPSKYDIVLLNSICQVSLRKWCIAWIGQRL